MRQEINCMHSLTAHVRSMILHYSTFRLLSAIIHNLWKTQRLQGNTEQPFFFYGSSLDTIETIQKIEPREPKNPKKRGKIRGNSFELF